MSPLPSPADDYASDIWSLGLVLLEAATGSFPYPQATAQIAMVMTITEGDEPLPPREGGEFTPQFHDVSEALQRCIQTGRASGW